MFDIFITAAVIVFIFGSLYWLYGKNMFVIIRDKSYRLFSTAFILYRSEVINRKKLYERYVDDFCIQNTRQVPYFIKNGVVNSSNEKNYVKNRVQKLLETRPELVHKYFKNKNFTYEDYKHMIDEFDTTVPIQKPGVDLIEMEMNGDEIFFSQNDISNKDNKQHFEEKKKKLLKDFILKCYSMNRKMQLGDRTFGYLIKAELIAADTQQEQLDTWHELLGEDITPSNVKLFSKPNYSRSKSKNLLDFTLLEHLEKIQNFFNEIGLKDVASIVGKDIEKELSKKK